MPPVEASWPTITDSEPEVSPLACVQLALSRLITTALESDCAAAIATLTNISKMGFIHPLYSAPTPTVLDECDTPNRSRKWRARSASSASKTAGVFPEKFLQSRMR